MEFAVSGCQIVAGLGIIGLAISILIFSLRNYFNQKLTTKIDQSWSSRTKYAAYDVFGYSSLFFRAGLICALVSSLLAFNYTQFNYMHEPPAFVPDNWVEPIAPPITYPEPKPIPKPPVSPKNDQIIEVVDEITQPTFVEVEVNVDEVIDPNAQVDNDAPIPSPLSSPPTLPEVSIEVDDEPVIFAELLPHMCSSCDAKNISRQAKNDCAKKEMMTFVQKRLKYPSLAREIGVQGMCPVRFVVKSDGSISNIELLRDIGAGCGKEALRVVKMLQGQCWQPGKQNGRSVSVQMVLPIRFQLQ